jgi:hypothetical protein
LQSTTGLNNTAKTNSSHSARKFTTYYPQKIKLTHWGLSITEKQINNKY